jgi:hypothetical protein
MSIRRRSPTSSAIEPGAASPRLIPDLRKVSRRGPCASTPYRHNPTTVHLSRQDSTVVRFGHALRLPDQVFLNLAMGKGCGPAELRPRRVQRERAGKWAGAVCRVPLGVPLWRRERTPCVGLEHSRQRGDSKKPGADGIPAPRTANSKFRSCYSGFLVGVARPSGSGRRSWSGYRIGPDHKSEPANIRASGGAYN